MRLLTKEQIVQSLLDNNRGCTFEDDSYRGAKVKHKFRCKCCGEYFQSTYDSVIRRSFGYCPTCNAREGKRIWDIDDVQKYVEKEGNGTICIGTEYYNNHKDLLFRCKCGNKFKRSFISFKSSYKVCPICTYEIIGSYQSKGLDFILEFTKKIPETSEYISGEYKNQYSNLTFKCGKCDDLFDRNWGTIRKNDKYLLCLECGTSKFSIMERDIGYILMDWGYELDLNRRDIIAPKEIDIYIPSINLAIEVNGDYWHTNKPDNYHKMKYDMCKQKGIDVWFIWEHIYHREDFNQLLDQAMKGNMPYEFTLAYCEAQTIVG